MRDWGGTDCSDHWNVEINREKVEGIGLEKEGATTIVNTNGQGLIDKDIEAEINHQLRLIIEKERPFEFQSIVGNLRFRLPSWSSSVFMSSLVISYLFFLLAT